MTVWSTGGYRQRRSSARPSAVQVQRQLAQAERAPERAEKLAIIRELAITEQQLLAAHRESFPPIERPAVATPIWVTPAPYLAEAQATQLAGVARFDRRARQAALAAAEAIAADNANRYNAYLAEQWREQQRAVDAQWQALQSNEVLAVLDEVNEAFADNASPAAALGVDAGEISLLMIQPAIDEFGDRKAGLTAAGNPTVARMTKTEQRHRWTSITLSRVIATIGEAFASAPAITGSHIVVLSRGDDGTYRLLLIGAVSRADFFRASWPAIMTPGALAGLGTFQLRPDRYGALTDIASEHPELANLVAEFSGLIDEDEEAVSGALPPAAPTAPERPAAAARVVTAVNAVPPAMPVRPSAAAGVASSTGLQSVLAFLRTHPTPLSRLNWFMWGAAATVGCVVAISSASGPPATKPADHTVAALPPVTAGAPPLPAMSSLAPITSSSAPPTSPTTSSASPAESTTALPPTPTSRQASTTHAAAPPAPALTCSAAMSNSSPEDYSTDYVQVQVSQSGASVTVTAHYKTTETTHSTTASGTSASIAFMISRATPGYEVDVSVDVSKASASSSCSTSFTPR